MELYLLHPFHYSFLVTDLNRCREFYINILQCKEGRSSSTWVDFNFFGNQISAHLTDRPHPSKPLGKVEGISVPIPHFGVILPGDVYLNLLAKVEKSNIDFIIHPQIRFKGKKEEQSIMFFLDPFSNAIEIKSFTNPQGIF